MWTICASHQHGRNSWVYILLTIGWIEIAKMHAVVHNYININRTAKYSIAHIHQFILFPNHDCVTHRTIQFTYLHDLCFASAR